jgi:hypothetical protein
MMDTLNLREDATLGALFLEFAKIGLCGIGSMLVWTRRVDLSRLAKGQSSSSSSRAWRTVPDSASITNPIPRPYVQRKAPSAVRHLMR